MSTCLDFSHMISLMENCMDDASILLENTISNSLCLNEEIQVFSPMFDMVVMKFHMAYMFKLLYVTYVIEVCLYLGQWRSGFPPVKL